MLKTLSFFGSCSARSELVLMSPRITTSYRLKTVQVEFADGCDDLLQIEIFQPFSDYTPSSGKPDGVSLLGEYGQVPYIVGDGMNKRFDHELEILERGTWLSVYANNTDYFDHDVIVLLTIDLNLE